MSLDDPGLGVRFALNLDGLQIASLPRLRAGSTRFIVSSKVFAPSNYVSTRARCPTQPLSGLAALRAVAERWGCRRRALCHRVARAQWLASVSNLTLMKCCSHCIVAFNYQLAQRLPWAQQLETGSNGKSVSKHGVARIRNDVGPVGSTREQRTTHLWPAAARGTYLKAAH